MQIEKGLFDLLCYRLHGTDCTCVLLQAGYLGRGRGGEGTGLTEGLAHLLDRFRAAAGTAVRALRLELTLLLVFYLQVGLIFQLPVQFSVAWDLGMRGAADGCCRSRGMATWRRGVDVLNLLLFDATCIAVQALHCHKSCAQPSAGCGLAFCR